MNANNAVRLDDDPQETREWLESIESVLSTEGRPRAHYLIDKLKPLSLTVEGRFTPRGGIPFWPVARYESSGKPLPSGKAKKTRPAKG